MVGEMLKRGADSTEAAPKVITQRESYIAWLLSVGLAWGLGSLILFLNPTLATLAFHLGGAATLIGMASWHRFRRV